MLRNIYQFEKGHSGIHLARTQLGCALFLKRRGALNYRAFSPSMIPVENEVLRSQTPQKNLLQVVQRTKQAASYFLTHIR